MSKYSEYRKKRKQEIRRRRAESFRRFLHQLDMLLFAFVHRFDKENREKRRKIRREKYRKFFHFLDTFLYFQVKKLSKEGRQIRKKRKQESRKRFLLWLDAILFSIIGYYSKEAREGRRKEKQEAKDIASIKLKTVLDGIRYYNTAKMRKERSEKRKQAFSFLIKQIAFLFEFFIYRIYRLIVDLKYWLKDKENKRNFWINAVNSTALFMLAYFVMFFIYQLFTMLVAQMYNIPSRMLYFKTDFLVHSSSNLWSPSIVIQVCFIGPLVCLFLGFVILRLFHYFKRRRGMFKLFLLWCSIHGFNMFFGAYVGGIFSDKGFGLVVLWFFLQFFLNVVLGFVSVIMLIFIGALFAKAFLQTAHNSNMITKENRPYFIFAQVLLPYIFGNMIIDLAIELPGGLNYNKLYQMVMVACIGFIIFPMLSKPHEEEVRLVKEESILKVNAKLVISFILVAIAFRFGLQNGFRI